MLSFVSRRCAACARAAHVAGAARRASSHIIQTVFALPTKMAQRRRAAVAPDAHEYDYLRDEIAARLVERLGDVARDFPHALDLGANTGNILKQLLAQRGDGRAPGGIQKLHMLEPTAEMLHRDAETLWPAAAASGLEVLPHVGALEGEPLPYADASMDLVVSSMSLHWTNDVPGIFAEVRRVLKPDGAFVFALLGGETLQELRQAFVVAEQERDGGVSPRISPMMHLSDAGNLLSAAGFGIPTVDADTFTVEYPSPGSLYHHLRSMGESNAALGARQGPRSDTLLAAAVAYVTLFGEGDDLGKGEVRSSPISVPATYQTIFGIAWAPAPTQPKPKARGSVPRGFAGGGPPPPPLT